MRTLFAAKLLIIICVFCNHVSAQVTDSVRINKLTRESFDKTYSDPQTAKILAQKALNLARQSGSCYLEAEAFNQFGIVYDVTNNYDSAIYCYNRAISLAQNCHHEVQKAQALNNLGMIYWNKGDLDKAIENYTLSLRIFEKHHRDKGAASALSNIAIIYKEQNEYEKAINFQKRALALRKKIKDSYGMSVSYANLGNVYTILQKLDSARYYIYASLALKDSLKDLYGMAINYSNLAVILKMQHKPDSAILATRKTMALTSALGEKNMLASDYFTMAGFYIDKKDYRQAYQMLDSARILAEEVGAKMVLLGAYQRMVEVDTLLGNYRQGITHFAHYEKLKHELYSVEKEKVISEIQTRYETEKKERELAENRSLIDHQSAEVTERTNWAIIAATLLLFVTAFGLYTVRHQKLKQQKIREAAKLREELARAAVQSRLQEERVRISRDLHDHIGTQLTIMANSLDRLAYTEEDKGRQAALYEIGENGREAMLQLRETIWAMNQEAISLESLAAKTREFTSMINRGKIEVKLESDDEHTLSPGMAINLFRIVQEAVSNALKYADFSKLWITICKNEEYLSIEIRDDGKGFNIDDTHHKGYGLINIRERARDFGALLHLDSRPGKGTIVKISVPMNRANDVFGSKSS